MRDADMLELVDAQVTLTNPAKVVYPATGTTKQDVFDYYTQIAPVMLPHLRRRPITRRVWPNGVDQPMFYSKGVGKGVPTWLPTVAIQHTESVKDYVLFDTVPALQWDAQTAGLEIHVPQWRLDAHDLPLPPDRMVIDLDPGEGAGLAECAEVALLIRPIFEGMGLDLFPLTSGSKGIHLYASLTGYGSHSMTSDEVSAVAKELAKTLESAHPHLVISTMSKASRKGKVMVDWSQNNAKKTTISPYSLRGIAMPNVVAPRTWDEIAAPGLEQLTYSEVLERVAKSGDIICGLADGSPGRAGRTAAPGKRRATARPSDDASTNPTASRRVPRPRGLPTFEPMLASMPTEAEKRILADSQSDDDWAFELKWDGYRAIATIYDDDDAAPGRSRRVRIMSRGGQDYTDRYPELEPIAEQVSGPLPVVLDGEIVALGKNNRPSFADLQSHAIPVTFQAFDILQRGDEILATRTYETRRAALAEALDPGDPIHISPELAYQDAMAISEKYRLEGVMAKRRKSTYQPGARSRDWLKLKHLQSGEFVVVGWIPSHASTGAANPKSVGSLLLAQPLSSGKLKCVGRVGTGFTTAARRELAEQLSKIALPTMPSELENVSKAESDGAVWVRPNLLASVEFGEWTTSSGTDPAAKLRHARFRGIKPS